MGLKSTGFILLFLIILIACEVSAFNKKSRNLGKRHGFKSNVDVLASGAPIPVGNKTRLPHNLLVHQYILQIQPYVHAPGVTYDPSKDQTFDGFARIDIQMLETATSVSVDVYNMTIYSAQVFLNGNRIQLVSASYDYMSNRFTITPVFFLKQNYNYTLEFKYSAKILSYEYGGLFASTYTFPNGTQGTVYATHFETFPDQIDWYDPTIGSSRVFPSFDDPHFKAVFNLTLFYPSSLKAIGNMLEGTPQDIGSGWSQMTFPLTNRQSSYLLAFAFGDLVSKSVTMDDGFLVRTWGWRGTENFLDHALQQSEICVDVMNKFTGIKLPFKKLDVLAVPFFTAGGMENWGLIINQADFVLFNPNEDTPGRSQTGMDVNCHEIAHQWFGDLVTNDWWSDIMLHESFAAFFEDYTVSAGWPQQALYWDSLYVQGDVEDGFQDDTYTTEAIVTKNGDFDGPVYTKGSSVLRMLQATLTPSVFQEGLQNYLNKYKFSTADHHQLFAAMTETASKYPQIVDWCKRPLNVTRFMDPWVEMPHYPVLTVNFDPSSNSYMIDQQPFLGYKNLGDDYSYSWPLPFFAKQINGGGLKQYWSAPSYPCFGSSKNFANVFEDIEFSNSAVRIPSTSSDALLVNFDTKTFARVHYDDYTFNQIVQTLTDGKVSFTDNSMVRLVLDEIAIVDRDRALGVWTSYIRPLRMIAAVLKNPGTDSVAVFLAANKLINKMNQLGMDSYERDLYNHYYVNILTPLYSRTGWQVNKTDDWNALAMNLNFLPSAVKLNIGDAQAQALVQFSNLVSKCSPTADFISCNNIDTSFRQAVYCGAAIRGGKDIVEHMYSYWLSADNTYSFKNQEAKALSQGMACTTDPSAIETYVKRAICGRLPLKDIQNLASNPAASDVIYNFLSQSFSSVVCKDNAFYYAMQTMTANWITPARIQQLQDLGKQLKQQFSASDNQVFNDALNSVTSRAAFAMADRSEIVRFLFDEYAPDGEYPWTARLPSNVLVPQSYEVSVLLYIPNTSFQYLPEKNFTFDANSTVTFKTLIALNKIVINSHRHVIESFTVSYPADSTVVPVTSIARDYNNAFLTLNLASTIPAGSVVQISFIYSGFIFEEIGSEGNIINYDYLKGDNRKSWIFATDFEAGPSTRSLLPCFDEPSLKAKWQVTVTYPGEYTALSNTLEESVGNIGNGLLQTRFKQTMPMSSYLLALTIGHYSSVRGVTQLDGKLIRIWTWTGMEQYGLHALSFAINTIDYLSKTLNVSLPLEKFDVLALPQYSGSAAGAMENWGLVIAGYHDVLYNPDYTTTAQLANIQDTVSHELTHHWFGDFVTTDWWTHLFLNEGFATYWPPRTLKATTTQSAAADYAILDIYEISMILDAIPQEAEPVVPDNSIIGGEYPLFGQAVYRKGASVITTLKNVYGNDSIFYKGLNNYLVSHGLGNSDDLGLWRAMDSLAQSYKIKGWTGNSLSATTMMLPYTMQWSGPLVRVIQSSNGFSLAQGVLSPSNQLPQSSYNYQWIVPLKTSTPGGEQQQWLSQPSGNLNLQPSSFTIVNPRAETHVRVLYDDASWTRIYNQLKTDLTQIDEVSRAQLLTDSYAHVRAKRTSWQRFLSLTTYLSNETGFLPWIFAIRKDYGGLTSGFVPFFLSQLKYHPVFGNLKIYLRTLSSQLSLGNLNRGDDWSQNMLNSSLLELRCLLDDPNCLALTSNTYNQFINQCAFPTEGTGKCNPASPDFRATQLCYGLRQNTNTFATLRGLADWWLQNPQSNDYFYQDRDAIFNGLGCAPDSSSLYMLIGDTLSGKLPSAMLGFIGQRDTNGVMFNYLASNATAVINSGLFSQYISAMTLDWSTDQQLNNIQTFTWPFKLNKTQQDAVDLALATITDLRTWLAADGVTIQNWINTFVTANSG